MTITPTAPRTKPVMDPAAVPSAVEVAFSTVNRSVPRRDGIAKVTGQAEYAGDVPFRNMAYAKLLRSPYAHARLMHIDASAAMQRPGVIAVLTGDDCATLAHALYGHSIRDHPILALDRVRFAGEPVAAIIAEDERTAQLALADIDVEYEPLAAVMNTVEATAPGAPQLHDALYERGPFSGVPGPFDIANGNVCYHEHLEWGDVDEAFAAADHIVESEYGFPLAYAYAMEPYVATADFSRGDELTVISSAQHPYMVRTDLAWVFGLPLSRVRLEVPYVGGGYGSKSYTKIEPVTAMCSRAVGRPVRLELSVEEAMLTTRVAGARMWLKTGFTQSGRILAREARLYFDGGAYAENGPLGASKSAERVLGPYRVPAVRTDSYLVYTNTSPSSSFRGFGTTQAVLACEAQLDEAARDLRIDRVELRAINMVAKGEPVHRNARPLDGDLIGDLRLAAQSVGWRPDTAGQTSDKDSRTDQTSEGQGIAVMAMGAGAYPVSTAEVRVHSDDSVSLLTGSTEIGQGSETVMAQIAAEVLRVPLEAVNVVRSKTGLTPFERSTGASRSTTLQGRAIVAACVDAIDRLKAMVEEESEVPGDLQDVPGGILINGEFRSWGSIITRYFGLEGAEVVGTGHVRRAGEFFDRPAFWELSAVALRIRVDRDTGRVQVPELSTVADIGLAIHPAMMEGQDLGAAIQGFGPSLFEELVYDGQQLSNGTMLSYRVPRFTDVPSRVDLRLVENRDGVGPFGAKGGGEGAISPIAPAIMSALHDATGVWIRDVPLTPERVWRALRNAQVTATAGQTSGQLP